MMREIKLNPIKDVLNIVKKMTIKCESEHVHISKALNRVIVNDLLSDQILPAYRKSTVDGYAIKRDGLNPKYLLGENEITHHQEIQVNNNCIYVPTGGRVPKDADCVVKIEDTKRKEQYIYFDDISLDNIIEKGADMHMGKLLKKKSSRLNVFDIGVLASLGQAYVEVYKKPRLQIISTGDELISLDEAYYLGAVRDINSYTLKAYAEQVGFDVGQAMIVKDSYDALKQSVLDQVKHCDVLIISGGSSMGKKDFTYDLLCDIGLVKSYGMALKPGKPTIIAEVNNKAVFGLPGHPVSSIMVFKILMQEFLKHYHIDLKEAQAFERILKADVYAAKGRDTYQMLRLDQTYCYPTSGKSGMITLLSGSEAYMIIPKDTCIKAGEKVLCYYL